MWCSALFDKSFCFCWLNLFTNFRIVSSLSITTTQFRKCTQFWLYERFLWEIVTAFRCYAIFFRNLLANIPIPFALMIFSFVQVCHFSKMNYNNYAVPLRMQCKNLSSSCYLHSCKNIYVFFLVEISWLPSMKSRF